MKVKIMIALLCCLGVATLVSAEFYQYTEKNGVKRFTDNIVDVPVAKRQAAKRFDEPDDQLTPEQLAEKERLKKEGVASPSPSCPDTLKLQQQEAAVLNAKKTELDGKTAALLKERNTLLQEEKRILSNNVSQYEEYRQKVADFNRRLASHQKELKLFNEKVEAYNKDLKLFNETVQAFNKAGEK